MAIINGMKNLTKIGLQSAKQGAKKGIKGAEKLDKTLTNGAVKKGTKKSAQYINSKAQFTKPFIDVVDKETGEVGKKTMHNFYTGKKANPLYVGVIGGGYLAATNAYKGTQVPLDRLKLATMNDFQNYGAPDVMMYDGVSQDQAPKNLNADGSLVFGLHNSRKG